MISLRRLIAMAYPERRDLDRIPETPLCGIECDSRKVEEGFLFIAIQGRRQNGADFIPEALRRGAVAVVSAVHPEIPDTIPLVLVAESRSATARLAVAFYGHPSRRLRVIGITGTNGKTTVSYLLEHLLQAAGEPPGVIGTVNYRYAGWEIPAVETTPGPLRLQQILSMMSDQDCRAAVMEVSSHALDQGRTEGIDFEAGVFTNLTHDHLDYHRTLENYFEAKSRLFLGLRSDKTSVLNADDPWAARLAGKVRSRVLTYGVHAPADLKAGSVQWDVRSTRAELCFRGRIISMEIPLVGMHNVYNALAALAAFMTLGHDLEKGAASLNDFHGVPGRLEPVDGGQDFLVFVDFAHTPDGLKNVLEALKPYQKGKIIALFGCGGDRDKGKRPKMAAVAAELCDRVIVTSDNPRSEDPAAIVRDICAGFPPSFKNYSAVIDRKKAIRQALLAARAGDIVLLAGKGHEKTQVIGAKAVPFDDREEAEEVLSGH